MAFKMKNQSMAKMVKAAGDSRVAMKMKAESAMKKELVGDQGNLPPELKAKIEAAPSKMKSAMKKTDDEMDRLMKIKRNTDPNDRDAVREINEKIRAHSRKIGVKDVAKEETGGSRAKMKEKSPSAMKKNGDDAKIKALQARLAKAMKEGNDREINAIRQQIKDAYKSEKQGKQLEKFRSGVEKSPQSAMKKDLPEVRITGKKEEKKKGPRKVTRDLKYPFSRNKFGDILYKGDILDKREVATVKDSDLYEYNTVKPTKGSDSAVQMKRKGDGKLKTQPGTTRITDKDLDKKQKIEDAANKGDKKAMILRRYQALGPKALTAEELKMIGK